MRVIILGDISVDRPYAIAREAFAAFGAADLVVANLEGLLLVDDDALRVARAGQMVFYNALSVLDVLEAFHVRAVCLANNHLYDLPLPAAATGERLAAAGIAAFGAGANLEEAGAPLVFSQGSTTLKVFALGWEVIGCRPARARGEGVNPLTPQRALETIRRLRADDQESCVIFLMHWNFELELYPQPAHRQLAHDLIASGVDAVIGMHPHVAGGVELVEGRPVVYSLGNWFLPARQVGPLHVAYPPIAARELAVTLEIEGRQVRDVRLDWYQFDAARNALQAKGSEDSRGATVRELTPYAGMSHAAYREWFKANRTRRRGLPIYHDYTHIWRNRVRDRYTRARQAAVETLVRLRLKGGPRA